MLVLLCVYPNSAPILDSNTQVSVIYGLLTVAKTTVAIACSTAELDATLNMEIARSMGEYAEQFFPSMTRRMAFAAINSQLRARNTKTKTAAQSMVTGEYLLYNFC